MSARYQAADFGPAPWQLDRKQELCDWLEGLDRDEIETFKDMADPDNFPCRADYLDFINACDAEIARRDA